MLNCKRIKVKLINYLICVLLFISPLWSLISPSTCYITLVLISLISTFNGIYFSKNHIKYFFTERYFEFTKIKNSNKSNIKKTKDIIDLLNSIDFLILFIILAFLLIPFSIYPLFSTIKLFGFMLISILGIQWLKFFKKQDELTRNSYAKSLMYGSLVIILIIIIETFGNGYIQKNINNMNIFEGDRSHAKIFISCSIFTYMIMIALWNNLKIIKFLSPIFILALINIDSDSLLMGMILGVIFASINKASIKIKKIISATISFGTLVSPIIAFFVFSDSNIGQFNKYTKDVSVLHRISLWHESSKFIFERPITGHGFNATRKIGDDHKKIEFVNSNNQLTEIYISKIGSHAHNYALQFWLEFGILGALLISLFVYKISLKSFTLNLSASFAFSIIFSVFAFSTGAFQTWWIGIIWILLPFWQNQSQNYYQKK